MEGSIAQPPPESIRETFGPIIAPRLRQRENLDQVLAGSWKLALRRADLLRRRAIPPDIEFVLAALCWWPFKPELSQEAQDILYRRRSGLFTGGAYGAIDMPDEILTASLDELHQWQMAGEWPDRWP